METLYPTSIMSNSNWLGHSTTWTKEENKTFESAIAIFDEKTPNRWLKVASMIPGKSVNDVKRQYRELVADVSDIEAGLVPVPGYLTSSFSLKLEYSRGLDVCRKRARTCDQERKKGVPWTEEEHRRFLLGLQKYGKGDWRNISRYFVISKTPTQVASHAQKYYLRQLPGGKDKRRPSIHDITTVHLSDASQTGNRDLSYTEKPNELTSIEKCGDIPNILMDWNYKPDGSFMFFNSGFGDSFMSYPQEIATQGHYIINIDASGPAFHIQSPRFRD